MLHSFTTRARLNLAIVVLEYARAIREEKIHWWDNLVIQELCWLAGPRPDQLKQPQIIPLQFSDWNRNYNFFILARQYSYLHSLGNSVVQPKVSNSSPEGPQTMSAGFWCVSAWVIHFSHFMTKESAHLVLKALFDCCFKGGNTSRTEVWHTWARSTVRRSSQLGFHCRCCPDANLH